MVSDKPAGRCGTRFSQCESLMLGPRRMWMYALPSQPRYRQTVPTPTSLAEVLGHNLGGRVVAQRVQRGLDEPRVGREPAGVVGVRPQGDEGQHHSGRQVGQRLAGADLRLDRADAAHSAPAPLARSARARSCMPLQRVPRAPGEDLPPLARRAPRRSAPLSRGSGRDQDLRLRHAARQPAVAGSPAQSPSRAARARGFPRSERVQLPHHAWSKLPRRRSSHWRISACPRWQRSSCSSPRPTGKDSLPHQRPARHVLGVPGGLSSCPRCSPRTPRRGLVRRVRPAQRLGDGHVVDGQRRVGVASSSSGRCARRGPAPRTSVRFVTGIEPTAERVGVPVRGPFVVRVGAHVVGTSSPSVDRGRAVEPGRYRSQSPVGLRYVVCHRTRLHVADCAVDTHAGHAAPPNMSGWIGLVSRATISGR